MHIIDLIEKKKIKQELSKEEIHYLITNYVNGVIKDYQMSALLMAILLNGFSIKETSFLTLEMMHSGTVIDLSSISGIKVDKHSTGGVGDKTTLVVAPIIAALNIPVAKMSGRGLGHTGGTIDKLESIPGMSLDLTYDQFIEQVNKIKIAIIGQSDNLVPADKKIYALRDVTATINSLPLIASSIMSKKLATGSDAILLDVKCGNGAFMPNLEAAQNLAQVMIDIGKELKRDVRVEITNMDRPIGREIGNKNEVLEAIKTLKGEGSADFVELCYSSCKTIIQQAQKANSDEEAQKMIDEVISNGAALAKFYEFVTLQGGDVTSLQNANFWAPKYRLDVKALSSGYMNITSALIFGIVSSKLGAGRSTKEDKIDFEAGITIVKKTNEAVLQGETIFSLFSSKPIASALVEELQAGYEIVEQKVTNKIVLRRMK